MADAKISGLTAVTTLADEDLLPITDVSDTTQGVGGTTKKVTVTTLKTNISTSFVDTATLTAHTGNTSNPHSVTKTQVGLGNADNTSDLNKPISTATQSALDGKSSTSHNHTGTYEPANANIQSHISSTSNPHQVTATQVLPSQTNNSGKYLTTNGTTASWVTVTSGSGDMKADGSVDFTAVVGYNADKTFTTDQDIVSKKYVDDAIVAAGGYTDEQAQDAVGGALTDTATIDFTYTDATGAITADVKDGSITLSKMANLAQNTIIGRVTGSTGVPEALTATNVRTIINVADGATANSKATGAEVDTGTDDTKFVTAKALKDSAYLSSMSDVTVASDTAQGKVELATTSEATTGTDTERAVTPAGVKACTDALNSLTVTAAPSADVTTSGLKISLTAGETLAFGNICYVKSDGKAWKADANGTSTYPGLFMATGSVSADASGTFLALGIARDDSWSWTVGGFLYLSTTAGAMTQTAPSTATEQVQVLGVATHADRAWFYPQIILLERA